MARTRPLLSGRIKRARNMRNVTALPLPGAASSLTPSPNVRGDEAEGDLAWVWVWDRGAPRSDGMLAADGGDRRALRASV